MAIYWTGNPNRAINLNASSKSLNELLFELKKL